VSAQGNVHYMQVRFGKAAYAFYPKSCDYLYINGSSPSRVFNLDTVLVP